jgi:hypothetical protein
MIEVETDVIVLPSGSFSTSNSISAFRSGVKSPFNTALNRLCLLTGVSRATCPITSLAAGMTSLLNTKTGCTTRPFICWLTPLIRMRFSIFTCSGVPAGNTRGTIWLDAGVAAMK